MGGVDGHVCRVDLPEPAVPGRALFPLVHKSGRIGAAGMSGQAVNVVLARRATDAGYTAEQVAKLGGHSLRAGYLAHGGAVMDTPEQVITADTLTMLYGTPIDVLRDRAGRLVVVGQPDSPAEHR